MRRFERGQRVRVSHPLPEIMKLGNQRGTVVSVHQMGTQAIVEMDEPVPAGVANRTGLLGRQVLLYASECCPTARPKPSERGAA